MSKKIYSFLLAVMMIAVTGMGVSASEITDITQDHLIEVTGKFEEASTVGGAYVGFNINGVDAYMHTFEEGDALQYEVYLETNTPGVGHVEIQASKLISTEADGYENHQWEFLRMVTNRDAEYIHYGPSADLTYVAYKQWYKRTVPIPESFVGFTSRHIYLMVECYEIPEEPEFHFYIKNMCIVGADGEVKMDICSNDTEFIVGQLVEVSEEGTVSMMLNPVHPKIEEPEPTERVQENEQPVSDRSAPIGLKAGLVAAIVVAAVFVVTAIVVPKKKQ